MMSKRLLASSGCVLVLMLSACGGGGGGGGGSAPINSTPPPTPTPTPTPTPIPDAGASPFNTPEYQRSNGTNAHGAFVAYDSGATGAGVKIGIVDSGINPNLIEFAGRIDPASTDVTGGGRGVGDSDGHGTAVTAVAAAARNGLDSMGVAFDATIVSLRTDSAGTCASADDCAFTDSSIAAGVDAARLAGAKVINMSLGGSPPNSTLFNAIQRAVDAGIILVISAGNEGATAQGANPDPFALVPAQNFPNNVIIAGSVGVAATGGGTNLSQLSTFSNKAGTGAQNYLAAIGYRVLAPDNTGAQFLWSGTSFSAPVITGTVALLAQAFPNLTASQILQILFNSADDLGVAGTDSIYGRGRLNIAKAFQPSGTTTLAASQIAVGTGTSGDLPEAAGDGDLINGKMGVIILDGYSRAFVMDLAKSLRGAEASKPLHRALDGGSTVRNSTASLGPLTVAMTVAERPQANGVFEAERFGIGPDDARKAHLIAGAAIARLDRRTAAAFGMAEGAKALERRLSGAEAGAFLIARDISADPGFAARRNMSMAVRRNLGPVGMTIGSESGEVWQDAATTATGSPYQWTSVNFDKKLGRTWLSAGISRLDEKRTLLGGRLGEAFGNGGAQSLFVDLEARHRFGKSLVATLSARRGWTDFAGGSFQSGAFAFDLQKWGVVRAGDRIGLRLAQPLRIEQGGLGLMLPTAYSYATETATSSWSTLSLTPSGREVDAEISYSTPVAGGWLGGNLFARRQPGHVQSADADVGGAVRFTLGF
jgi:hypothetical protein